MSTSSQQEDLSGRSSTPLDGLGDNDDHDTDSLDSNFQSDFEPMEELQELLGPNHDNDDLSDSEPAVAGPSSDEGRNLCVYCGGIKDPTNPLPTCPSKMCRLRLKPSFQSYSNSDDSDSVFSFEVLESATYKARNLPNPNASNKMEDKRDVSKSSSSVPSHPLRSGEAGGSNAQVNRRADSSMGIACPFCGGRKDPAYPTCPSDDCMARLSYPQGLPDVHQRINPSPSGSGSYSSPVQTRRQTSVAVCQVCHERPRYQSKGKVYPTCSLTCAAKLQSAGNQTNEVKTYPIRSLVTGTSSRSIYTDKKPPSYQEEPPVPVAARNLSAGFQQSVSVAPDSVSNSLPARPLFPGVDICVVCQARPPYSKNGKRYPTCGLKCAGVLKYALKGDSSPGRIPPAPTYGFASQRAQPVTTTSSVDPDINLLDHLSNHSSTDPPEEESSSQTYATPRRPGLPGFLAKLNSAFRPVNASIANPCVVCRRRSSSGTYVTCGVQCAEKLCLEGGPSDSSMCTYCRRRPTLAGQKQCGKKCADGAKVACLLCKSRPKYKHYHLCGKTCRQISTKKTPLLLEVPEGHVTWDMVHQKFDSAWKYGTKPTIVKIYKIVESKTFLQPYDKYKKRVGRNTEVFRYHGTTRRCTLGSNGKTKMCNDNGCALCSILKTSFKTSLANPRGAFGAGVYSSSAANKAYSYSAQGNGAMILAKVVLGKVHNVNAFGEVSSCPAGFHSVVFDRLNGNLNETIVYSDDAIRPVFLIVFK